MKVRKVYLPCEFDLVNRDIILDLDNKELVVNVYEKEEKVTPIQFAEYQNKVYSLIKLKYIDPLCCVSENDEKFTLLNAYLHCSDPLIFKFDSYIKGILHSKKDIEKQIGSIEFNLSYLNDFYLFRDYYKYELKEFDLELKIDKVNKAFILKAINKNNLGVNELRESLNNIVYLLSMIMYNSFVVVSEKYFIKESEDIYEYFEDDFYTGVRKDILIHSIFIRDLFEEVFTETFIDTYLSNIDEEYLYFIRIYLYLIDNLNTNFANISEFLIIQLLISSELKYLGENKEAKNALISILNRKYIGEFVKEEMNFANIEKYIENLKDTRHGIGHLIILFKGPEGSKKSRIRKNAVLNIDNWGYYKLLLIYPFFFYSIMNATITDDLIKKIKDNYEGRFSDW